MNGCIVSFERVGAPCTKAFGLRRIGCGSLMDLRRTLTSGAMGSV